MSAAAIPGAVKSPVPSPWAEAAKAGLSMLNVRERTRNDSPQIREFWKAVPAYLRGAEDAQPWCAAFAAWCFARAFAIRDECRVSIPNFAAVSTWLEWC